MAALIAGLNTLRTEFNTINPKRDKRSDGWIGDSRHAETLSDHNPDKNGTVHAIDVDVDGVDMPHIVAFLVGRCKTGREKRLQYVIFRRTIWSRTWGWTARAYHGVNPHTQHAHFSARHDPAARATTPWGIAAQFAPKPGREESAPARKPAAPRPVVAHPAGSRVLALTKPVMTGADALYVQRWIGARAGRADGVFGPTTAAAVKWYQRVRDLPPTGKVDAATWRNMGVRWTGGTS